MRSYLELLSQLHQVLQPQTYLEIGTHSGTSLALASCASLSIDPQFVLDRDVVGKKPSCLMFQCSSDQFFARYNVKDLLADPLDLCFLDGMHLFEFLLRDFINVERVCRPNSIVAIHDLIPTDLRMASRTPILGEAWTGDVWKTLLILKRYRPDLRVLSLNATPTGLVLVTGFNPNSRLLAERYFSIVDEFRETNLEDIGLDAYRSEIDVVSTDVLEDRESVHSRFWL